MKLYIIGNGFDLNHGLNTDYKIYKEFNKPENYSTFLWYTEWLYRDIPRKLGDDDEIWKNAESNLSIDFSGLIEESIKDKEQYGTPILETVKLYTRKVEEFTTTNFFNWLKEYKNVPVKKKYNLPKDDLYLTFNYTDILETIYQIPSENILHIHGYVNNIDFENPTPQAIRNEIQFGAPLASSLEKYEKARLEYAKLIEEDDNIKQAFDHLENYVHCSTKNLESNYDKLRKFISEKEIDEIVVMGNSCWGVDFDYYKDVICPSIPNAEWTFLCHSSSDYDNIPEMCRKLGIETYTLLKWEEWTG